MRFLIIITFFPIILFSTTYNYDQSGRVIGITYDDGKEVGYVYDKSGNITNVLDVAQVDTSSGSSNLGGSDTINQNQTGGDSGGCFIATAAFGSYLHDDVMVLRNFRDKYLLTNKIGTFLVEDVYYKYSPPIANYIANSEYLKNITRWILTPIVYSVKYPLVVVLLILISIVLIRRKKHLSLL